MEATNTRLSGRPARRMSRVRWNCAWKVLVGVRVPSQPQRSLAPMRMVTYWAPWSTVRRAWAGPSAIRAPETALLWRRAPVPGVPGPDALVVAGDAVQRGGAGGPGVARPAAVEAADVDRLGDRVADGGHRVG